MSKRPSFAADVEELKLDVQQDLDRNVSTILSAVKQRKSSNVANSTDASAQAKSIDVAANLSATNEKPQRTTPVKSIRLRQSTPPEPLVNVTTRLPRQTKAMLTESVLRQKLAKATPDSEQAIIEEALQQWFKRHGYKRPDENDYDEHQSELPTAE